MHNGCSLFWQTNEAGGRTYHSNEIPCGVFVWDTCLVDMGTLCEAISMEFALLGVERRATEKRARQEAQALHELRAEFRALKPEPRRLHSSRQLVMLLRNARAMLRAHPLATELIAAIDEAIGE